MEMPKRNVVLGYAAGGVIVFVAAMIVWAVLAAAAPAVVPALVVVPPAATAVIVPPENIAVVVPVPPAVITPGVPRVVFIGVVTIAPFEPTVGQGLSDAVVVTFTEAMNPATVNDSTFMVKRADGSSLPGIITSDSTGKVWTFSPRNPPLIRDANYFVTITTGAKGVSGNALVENFLWSFTTGRVLSTASGSSTGGGGSSGGGSGPGPTPECTVDGDCAVHQTCLASVCTDIALVLTKVTLSPASTILDKNGTGTHYTQQMTTSTLDQFDAKIAATVVYTSSDTNVATVDANGLVTAVNYGDANIIATATSGTVTDSNIAKVTVAAVAGCEPVLASEVNLYTTGNFAIVSNQAGATAISTTSGDVNSHITGNIAATVGTSAEITGFDLVGVPGSSLFLTSALVTGGVYASNMLSPTPSEMTTAQNDLSTVYTHLSSGYVTAAVCALNLGAGNIGGMTLAPGVYKWTTGSPAGVTIPVDVTLSGDADDIWVFQISGDLSIAAAKKVILTGGADAKNVFWAVAGTTDLYANSVFKGNVVSGPGVATIALRNGAAVDGRLLGQKDVTLIGNTITIAD